MKLVKNRSTGSADVSTNPELIEDDYRFERRTGWCCAVQHSAPMQIEHVRRRVRAHGAKPCHEEVLLRSWAQALPFDSGQRGGQKPRTGAVEAP